MVLGRLHDASGFCVGREMPDEVAALAVAFIWCPAFDGDGTVCRAFSCLEH